MSQYPSTEALIKELQRRQAKAPLSHADRSAATERSDLLEELQILVFMKDGESRERRADFANIAIILLLVIIALLVAMIVILFDAGHLDPGAIFLQIVGDLAYR